MPCTQLSRPVQLKIYGRRCTFSSEDPEESGLPDEYHDLQPQFLSRTLTLAHYSREDWFAVWLPGLAIGLGIWQGEFEGATRPWLRWCDQDGNWLLLDTEQERLAKEQSQGQLVQAARTMVSGGMAIDEMVALLGLTDEQLKRVMEERTGS